MNTNQSQSNIGLNVNDVVNITITAALEYGLKGNVTLADGKVVRGLLHNNQISGKSPEAQAARRAELLSLFQNQGKEGAQPATVEVLVTRVEEVEATNPRLKGKKVVEIAFSERALIAKRGREAREARQAQEESILTGLTVGSEVSGKLVEVRDGLGAFVEIEDGVAAGRRALIHVTELSSHRSREKRDEVLESMKSKVGESVTATVVKVGKNDKGFITIGLSTKAFEQAAVAEEHAQLLERFPVGCELTGRLIKSTPDGLLLKVSQDGVEAVLSNLESGMREKIERAKSTRVVIEGVDDRGRLIVAKA